MARAPVLLPIASGACETLDRVERRTIRDEGLACIEAPPSIVASCEGRQVVNDVPLTVDVEFGTCTSSSCDRVLNAACSATRAGSVITIEAEAVIESQGSECTDDCGFVTASCELAPLPAGTYEVRYGDDSLPLTVPSITGKRCVGENRYFRCCDTSADCDGKLCENHHCRF